MVMTNLMSKIEDLQLKIATYDEVLSRLRNTAEESSHDRSSPVSSAGTSSSSTDSLESVIIASGELDQQLKTINQKREEAARELLLHNELSSLLSEREKLIGTLSKKADKSEVISRAEIERWTQFAESCAWQDEKYKQFRYKHSASYECFARTHWHAPQSQRASGVSFFSLTHLVAAVSRYDSKVSRTLQKLARIAPDLSHSIEEELAKLNDAIQENLVALEKGQNSVQRIATNSNSLFAHQGSSLALPGVRLGL